MPLQSVPILEPLAVPSGSPEYEAKRRKIALEFAASVPHEFLLSQEALNAAPKNVLGIPRQCGLLSDRELSITEHYDAFALADAIAARKFTAVEVVTAFAKRALIAHQLTSCLTEWFLDKAINRAKELDHHLKTTGSTIGRLHGVPISIKVHIPVAGHWSNVGFLSTMKKDEQDCQMIRILRDAGAVFYCKTNQPQAIMHLESTSPFGRTLNPYNTKLSAGGSSGGEAALVALRGSVLGIGTDIGGSIREPAAFCGIYGYKPTSYTVPMRDFLEGGASAELNILISAGPMCTSLRDMDLFMSVLSAAKPYLEDPRVLPIPWYGLVGDAKQLRIGFMVHDGVIIPQPPVARALKWAWSQLEGDTAFEIKPFEPFETAKAIKNIREAYWPDGGQGVREALAAAGEPMLPLTEWIIKDAAAKGPLSAEDSYQQRRERDQFRIDFAEHWTRQDVDLVICPAFVGPACTHETSWYWDYTALWNYLDCPGVVFPTPITAKKKDEEKYDHDTPLGGKCAHVRRLWADGDFEGAPVNLQIIARRNHDNELFAALAGLKTALQLP